MSFDRWHLPPLRGHVTRKKARRLRVRGNALRRGWRVYLHHLNRLIAAPGSLEYGTIVVSSKPVLYGTFTIGDTL